MRSGASSFGVLMDSIGQDIHLFSPLKCINAQTYLILSPDTFRCFYMRIGACVGIGLGLFNIFLHFFLFVYFYG